MDWRFWISETPAVTIVSDNLTERLTGHLRRIIMAGSGIEDILKPAVRTIFIEVGNYHPRVNV